MDEDEVGDCSDVATDYISLWHLVHRAEEAMLMVEPVSDVVAQAVVDKERLTGSNIPNNTRLLELQRLAIAHVDEAAAKEYFGLQEVKP